MDQDKKRELRQLKREIKRKGGKLRRRQLKQGLAENPEEAANTVVDFGRLRSSALNGLDRDQSWRQAAGSSPADQDEAAEDEPSDPGSITAE